MHAIIMQQTSIRISGDLLNALKSFKEEGESYEDIIWDLIEDRMELSSEVKKSLVEYEQEFKQKGTKNFHKWDDMKKELNLNV